MYRHRCYDFRSIFLTNIGATKIPDATQLNMSIVGSEDPFHNSSYVLIDNLATVNESRYEDDETEGMDKYVSRIACLGETVYRSSSMNEIDKAITSKKRSRAVWYSQLPGKRSQESAGIL